MFADDGRNVVSVASLDGKHRRILAYEDVHSPRAIALHYSTG